MGPKPHGPELEIKVTEWVLDKRMNGIGLFGTMTHLKVGTLWLYCFMKRKGL